MMWVLDKALRGYIKRGEITLIDHDGTQYRYGAPDGVFKPVTVRLADAHVASDIVKDPGLGAAEAFMDGRLVLEQGEILDLVNIVRGSHRWEDSTGPNPFLKKGSRLGHKLRTLNWRPAALRNVSHHYDVGNEFYRLWLDERMVYSCGFFPTDDASLDEAQLAKLDLVLDKLGLRDGMRLLDIGCGWGGLLFRAAERADVEVVGITLSERQHAHVREQIAARGLQARVRVELLDYRVAPEQLGGFDRIASVGMAEHVGRARIDEYFAAARAALTPGGLFLNHAITAQPSRQRSSGLMLGGPLGSAVRTRSFIDAYVFPDGELLSLAEMLAAAQRAGFEVRDVESLRPHYARTLRHWVRRLEEHWDEAVAATSEAVARTWRLYMAGAAIGFERARLDLHQQLLVLPRPDGSSDAPAVRTWS